MSLSPGWGAAAYMARPDGPVVSQFMDFALDQVVAVYGSAGIPLPSRRYWSIGSEAFDCEQAVLTLRAVSLGTAGGFSELTQCDGPRSLSFALQVVRCVPVADSRGRAPVPEAIEEASRDVALDFEVMIYSLPAALDVYQTGVVAGASAIAPEGGFHGAAATYTVNL